MIEIARGHSPTAWHVAGLLLLQAGGAIALGIAAAWVISTLMCMVCSYQVDILLTITLSLGAYALADAGRLSAPLEAVVAGIALRHFNRRQRTGLVADERVDQFWTLIDEVLNSILFVLLGLEVLTVSFNLQTVRAGASAVLSVNLVRLAIVAACVGLVRLIRKKPQGAIFTMTWGGLRGGLSIALALSVPAALGGSWIFRATYIMVVFSILIQGGSLHYVLTRHRNQEQVAA